MKKLMKLIFGSIVVLSLSVFIVGSLNAAEVVIEVPGDRHYTDAFSFGTDTLTTDGANPGTATATLAVFTTYITSTTAGDQVDIVYIPDGTIGGLQKRFILAVDGEATGTTIAPTSEFVADGTSTLLEAIGDSVTWEWSHLGWTLVANIGGTVQ